MLALAMILALLPVTAMAADPVYTLSDFYVYTPINDEGTEVSVADATGYKVSLNSDFKTVLTTAAETTYGGWTKGTPLPNPAPGGQYDSKPVTSMKEMFYSCRNMTSLDLSTWDVSNVTNMFCMLQSCHELEEINVSGWDTSNVTNMGCMFNGNHIVDFDFTGWDTSNVTKMNSMFAASNEVVELDLSAFNTENVTDMNRMFLSCSKLEEVDFTGWDTSNVKDMSFFFSGCAALETIEFPQDFDTSAVTNMTKMFYDCVSLTSADLSSFDTSSVTNFYGMFDYCLKLNYVDLSNFTFKEYSTSTMLSNAGENNTTVGMGIAKDQATADMLNNSSKTSINTAKLFFVAENPEVVVTLGDSLIENGKEQTQEVKSVTVDGVEQTFTVTGNKATEPGVHIMTITLTGGRSDVIEKDFVVLPKDEAALENIGDVSVDVEVGQNVPKTELQNSKSEMIQIALTADELAAVANGDSADVWIEVADATDSISDESKAAIAKATEGYEMGQYIDISLFKKLDSQEDATKIHETGKMIKITITIPDKFLSADRTFFIVRNHDGEVTVIDGVFDKDAKTFTFETDRFSDYAIVYKDGVDDATATPDAKGADAAKNSAAPQTNDTNNFALWIFMISISGAALTATTMYDKKRKATR